MRFFSWFVALFLIPVIYVAAQVPPGSGKALQFNGSSSYIDLGTNNRNITNQVTLEAWVKTTSSKHQWIVGKYNNPQDNGYHIFAQNGKAALAGRDRGGVYRITGYSTTSIDDGKWHHIVGVVNLNNWEIYVDGQKENGIVTNNSNPVLTSNAPLTIGNYALVSDLYFQGQIDEVRIWNVARTGAEIRTDMCRKISPAAPNLVGYYKLDEGSGTVASDHATLNLPGTLINFSTATAWQTSGAPLGDVSVYSTNSFFPPNFRLKLPGHFADTLFVQNVTGPSGNNHSVHLYRVDSAPNSVTGVTGPASVPFYFGVFTAGSTSVTPVGYSLAYKPAIITCLADSAVLFKRPDNAAATWQPTGMDLNPAATFFEKPGEVYRSEYIPQSRKSQSIVRITGNQNVCAGTPVTLTASPSAGYLWNTGQTTRSITVTSPGTYSVTASSILGCVTSSSYIFSPKPVPVAEAGPDVSLCSGAPGSLGNNPVAGYSYSWSPAVGLSATNVANPSVTIPNNTAAPLDQTYTLTTTFNGCSTSDQVTVTVFPTVLAPPGLNRQVCSGEATLIGTPALPGHTYAWSPATGLSDPTVAQPILQLTNPSNTAAFTQTYTLTVTNAFGCAATGTVLINVLPATITDAGPDRAICSGGTTTIGSSGNSVQSYLWTPALGLSSANVSNPIVTLTNPGVIPYTITYKLLASSAGCTTIDSVKVTVNPLPFTPGGPWLNQQVCSDQPTSIGPPSNPDLSYQWSPVGGLSNPNIANPTLTLNNPDPNLPASHYYLLTVTDSLGCVNFHNVYITVKPPVITNAGPDRTICSGETVQLGTTGTAGQVYSWSPATGLSSTSVANPTVTLTNFTQAPITQVYTLVSVLNGCSTFDQVTVTVNPAITLTGGPDQTICSEGSVVIGTQAVPGFLYSWSGHPGISDPTLAKPVFTGLNNKLTPEVVTLSLQITETATGCAITDTVRVTINPKPVIDSLAGSPSVCPGVVGVDYRVVNPGPDAYQWLVQGGTIVSGQGTSAIKVDWGPSGNASVQAYTTNSYGCVSDTITFPVIINPLLITQKPAGPKQLCFYEAKNIHYQTPITTNGSFYTYQAFGGTITSPNPSSAGVTVDWHAPGVGKLLVTETSTTNLAFCFGVSDTLFVTINPSPDTTLAINGAASACALSLQNTYSLNGAPGSTYRWIFNGNVVPDTDHEIELDLPAAGNYLLTVVETNRFGCPGRVISKTITATPLPGTLALNGPTIICPDKAENQVYSVSGLPGSTYAWTVSGGTITSGNGTNTIYVDFDASSNKEIKVTEISSGNCVGIPFTKTATFDGSKLQLIAVSTAEANDREIELNLTLMNDSVNTRSIDIFRREANSGAGFQKIASVPNTRTFFRDANLETSQKIYEYRLESLNECGTQTRQTAAHRTVKLTATSQENTKNAYLRWNPYLGWGRSGVKVYEIFRKAGNGNYELVLEVAGSDSAAVILKTAPKGFDQCFRVKAIGPEGLVSWSNETCITFKNELIIYNLVTDNQDDKNDYFTVENIHLYPGNELTIFNRWGQELYRQQDYLNTWSGTGLPDGTYFYLLKLKDGRSFKGWFEKVR